MTTIAWDGTTLAADRCRTNGRGTRQEVCKLWHCGAYVFSIAGDLCDGPILQRWLRQGAPWRERPEMVDAQNPTMGLAIRKRDRAVFLIEGRMSMLVELPGVPTALGSGSPYALAAMACGKSAVDAIEIASRFDDGTGFGVDMWMCRKRGKR